MCKLSSKLMDASDLLSEVRDLVEAVFMAATDISDRKQQSAIQRVCDIADKRIHDISSILDDVGGEETRLGKSIGGISDER